MNSLNSRILRTEKMETLWILGVLLSICSLSFSQDCDKQLLENIEFTGSNFGFVFSPDANNCQLLCTKFPKCLYFTFIRADWSKDDRHFHCNLKTSPSGQPLGRTPLLGVTSGFSLKSCTPDPHPCLPQTYNNIDFPGDDYRTLFTADYEECQRVCTQDPTCQFFSFNDGNFIPESIRYKCFLKFSWTVPIIRISVGKVGAVSGFSHRAKTTQGSKPACQGKLFPNTDIPEDDIAVHPAASPEHCQALCSDYLSCTFFTFVSDNFNCHLKNNAIEMVPKAKEGVTSGLPARSCQLDNSWLQVAYKEVYFSGNEIRYELMDDADTCQKTCTDDPNCQFYIYFNATFSNSEYRRHCSLKRLTTMPSPSKVTKLDNVVSGFQLRNCVHSAPPTDLFSSLVRALGLLVGWS